MTPFSGRIPTPKLAIWPAHKFLGTGTGYIWVSFSNWTWISLSSPPLLYSLNSCCAILFLKQKTLWGSSESVRLIIFCFSSTTSYNSDLLHYKIWRSSSLFSALTVLVYASSNLSFSSNIRVTTGISLSGPYKFRIYAITWPTVAHWDLSMFAGSYLDSHPTRTAA